MNQAPKAVRDRQGFGKIHTYLENMIVSNCPTSPDNGNGRIQGIVAHSSIESFKYLILEELLRHRD